MARYVPLTCAILAEKLRAPQGPQPPAVRVWPTKTMRTEQPNTQKGTFEEQHQTRILQSELGKRVERDLAGRVTKPELRRQLIPCDIPQLTLDDFGVDA